jgi:hypothetical protein
MNCFLTTFLIPIDVDPAIYDSNPVPVINIKILAVREETNYELGIRNA